MNVSGTNFIKYKTDNSLLDYSTNDIIEYETSLDYVPFELPEDTISERELDRNIFDVDNMIKEVHKLRQGIKVQYLNEKIREANNNSILLTQNVENKVDNTPKVKNKIKLKELPKTPKPIFSNQIKPAIIPLEKKENNEFKNILEKLEKQDKAINEINTNNEKNIYMDIEMADAELEDYLNDIDDDIDEINKMGEEIELYIQQQKAKNK
jgi:hypothetical protein